MPNSLNTSPAPSVGLGTILGDILTTLPTALDVGTQNAAQLLYGLRKVIQYQTKEIALSHFHQIRTHLLAQRRLVTYKQVGSEWRQRYFEAYGTLPPDSSSYSPTTTPKESSPVSKPVILINIKAKEPSTTIKDLPQLSFLYTEQPPPD